MGSSAHTGARRGVLLLGRFLRPGHWLSHTGAPVRWQGGRKARMDETLAQAIAFRRRDHSSPKEIQCIRDATLVSGPNANAKSKRGPPGCRNQDFEPRTALQKKPSSPASVDLTQAHIVKLQDHWDFTDCPGHAPFPSR